MAMRESTWGSGLVEWQTAKRFSLGPFYVSLYYRYAINKCGQKTPSPFSHGSSGTSEYRELQLGYFVIGVSMPFKLFRKLKRFTRSESAMHSGGSAVPESQGIEVPGSGTPNSGDCDAG